MPPMVAAVEAAPLVECAENVLVSTPLFSKICNSVGSTLRSLKTALVYAGLDERGIFARDLGTP